MLELELREAKERLQKMIEAEERARERQKELVSDIDKHMNKMAFLEESLNQSRESERLILTESQNYVMRLKMNETWHKDMQLRYRYTTVKFITHANF